MNPRLFRKILLYVVAFMFSFMLFYTFYYVKSYRQLGGGYVADADTTKSLIVTPTPYQAIVVGKNISYNVGLIHTLSTYQKATSIGGFNTLTQSVDSKSVVSFIGKYNQKTANKIDIDLQNKFKKHPPLQFETLLEGDSLLFSYLFRNVILTSPNFGIGKKNADYRGKSIKYIHYIHTKDMDKRIKFISNPSEMLFSYEDEYGTLFSWYQHNNPSTDLTYYLKQMESFSNSNPSAINDKMVVMIPEIDLFIRKTYSIQQLQSILGTTGFSGLKRIEERVKIKTSVQGVQEGSSEAKPVLFNKNVLFSIKRKGAQIPYYMLLLNNPDALKH